MFYAIFFFAWMVFNGRWTLEVMLFGFGIAAVVYLFSWKALGYGRKHLYLKISEDFLNMHLFYGGKSLKQHSEL